MGVINFPVTLPEFIKRYRVTRVLLVNSQGEASFRKALPFSVSLGDHCVPGFSTNPISRPYTFLGYLDLEVFPSILRGLFQESPGML